MTDSQGPQKKIFEAEENQSSYMLLTQKFQKEGASFSEAKAKAFVHVVNGNSAFLADI